MLYEGSNPTASKHLAAAIMVAVVQLDEAIGTPTLNDYRQRAMDILHAQALEVGARLTFAPSWVRTRVTLGIELALSDEDFAQWESWKSYVTPVLIRA